MAGKVCPECGKRTFFENFDGWLCTKCGAKLKVPSNGGVGGKGKKCANCGTFTLINGKCTRCGGKLEVPAK